MGSFGTISLSTKFGIVLGSLIAIAFTAGFIKLWIIKRRLQKHTKLDTEAAGKPRGEKNMAGRENDPRYLFGVRAIEKGFYGGVAQTSKHNSYSTTDDSGGSISGASSNGTRESNLSSPSSMSLPTQQNRVKRKPSPLRLATSYAPSISAKSYSPKSCGSKKVGSTTEPSVSDQISVQDFQEPSDEQARISIPKATAKPGRPKSYLPRFDFSTSLVDPNETSFFITSPTTSVRGRRSKRDPARNHEAPVPELPSETQYQSMSHGASSTSTGQSQRSSSPQSSEREIPITRPIIGSKDITVPPIPETYGAHGRRESGARRSSNRDMHHNSAVRTTHVRRKSSDAVSLAALTGDGVVSSFPRSEEQSGPEATIQMTDSPERGRQTDAVSRQPRISSRSTSLSRTHDSIRRSSRKMSRERSASNRRSKQRDQMHYDPTPLNRTRGGSIQGRAVDFSNPRESPFTDSAAIHTSSHSALSSSSSSIMGAPNIASAQTMERFDLEALRKKKSAGERQSAGKLRYTRDVFGNVHLIDDSRRG